MQNRHLRWDLPLRHSIAGVPSVCAVGSAASSFASVVVSLVCARRICLIFHCISCLYLGTDIFLRSRAHAVHFICVIFLCRGICLLQPSLSFLELCFSFFQLSFSFFSFSIFLKVLRPPKIA